VIRIRYRDFSYGTHKSPGLHGIAKRGRRGVITVYLVPGLAGNERRAVFRRLRREASRGCGPELPVSQLAVAIGVDRVRVATRNLTAVVKLHPAFAVLAAVVLVFAMAFFVLAAAA
jgi:hypothetical protein